ncbi:MAG: DNA-binding protein [Lachnospiraceae bacterium]|nr:DNA-binding protein [Lachnospiraceae bacterium]
MERIVKLGLLYDFYGELLTDHQKKVYEDYVYNDYSISEIAEEYEISRQGASDLIKRINKILEGYETKLKLVDRFDSIKSKIEAIESISDEDKELLLKEL